MSAGIGFFLQTNVEYWKWYRKGNFPEIFSSKSPQIPGKVPAGTQDFGMCALVCPCAPVCTHTKDYGLYQ